MQVLYWEGGADVAGGDRFVERGGGGVGGATKKQNGHHRFFLIYFAGFGYVSNLSEPPNCNASGVFPDPNFFLLPSHPPQTDSMCEVYYFFKRLLRKVVVSK